MTNTMRKFHQQSGVCAGMSFSACAMNCCAFWKDTACAVSFFAILLGVVCLLGLSLLAVTILVLLVIRITLAATESTQSIACKKPHFLR